MTPGDRLRAAREAAGHRSARQAAVALGITYSTYLGHENGQNRYTAKQAEAYGRAFEVDPTWLLFGDDQPTARDSLTAAVALSSSAILSALVQSLHDKGLLSGEETIEVYESALLLLEMQQAKADETPAYGQVLEMARELIEQHLRPA